MKTALIRRFLASAEIKLWDDIKTRHAAHGFGFGTDPKSPETALCVWQTSSPAVHVALLVSHVASRSALPSSLWLDSDLSAGSCTFAHEQPFGVRTSFKIARIEVWGCGSADDLSSQERERLRDHQAAEQRQKVRSRAGGKRPGGGGGEGKPDL